MYSIGKLMHIIKINAKKKNSTGNWIKLQGLTTE